MKKIVLLAAASLAFACTTLRPVAGPSEQIHEQIRAGSLVAPGDRIHVTTRDGTEQSFRVAEIGSDGTLVGREQRVPIDEIVALEKRKTSWVKTGVLLGLLGLAVLDSDCSGDPCGPFGGGPFCCP